MDGDFTDVAALLMVSLDDPARFDAIGYDEDGSFSGGSDDCNELERAVVPPGVVDIVKCTLGSNVSIDSVAFFRSSRHFGVSAEVFDSGARDEDTGVNPRRVFPSVMFSVETRDSFTAPRGLQVMIESEGVWDRRVRSPDSDLDCRVSIGRVATMWVSSSTTLKLARNEAWCRVVASGPS